MAYWLGAATISVLYLTAGFTCGLFTREQKGEETDCGLCLLLVVVVVTRATEVGQEGFFFSRH